MSEQETALPTPPATNGTAPASGAAPSTEGHTNIEPGVFEMLAIDVDLAFTNGTESEPAKPQVAVALEFVDGPYRGQVLTWYGFFTDKTREGTIRALRLLGWTGDDLQDLSTVRGKAPCLVQVEPDLQGVKRARVRFVGSGGVAVKNRMNTDQKAAFAASMKAFASTIKAPEKTPENGPKTEGTPTGTQGKKFF